MRKRLALVTARIGCAALAVAALPALSSGGVWTLRFSFVRQR